MFKQLLVIFALVVFSYFAFYSLIALRPDIAKTILTYSSNVAQGNTSYPPFASQGTYFSVVLAWLYYLFYPFPWKIHGVLSFYFSLFGVLTFVLLILSAASYFLEKSEASRDGVLILLFLFCLTSVIYSIGTSNYGTSMRHEYLVFWILLLLGARGFILLKARLRGSDTP